MSELYAKMREKYEVSHLVESKKTEKAVIKEGTGKSISSIIFGGNGANFTFKTFNVLELNDSQYLDAVKRLSRNADSNTGNKKLDKKYNQFKLMEPLNVEKLEEKGNTGKLEALNKKLEAAYGKLPDDKFGGQISSIKRINAGVIYKVGRPDAGTLGKIGDTLGGAADGAIAAGSGILGGVGAVAGGILGGALSGGVGAVAGGMAGAMAGDVVGLASDKSEMQKSLVGLISITVDSSVGNKERHFLCYTNAKASNAYIMSRFKDVGVTVEQMKHIAQVNARIQNEKDTPSSDKAVANELKAEVIQFIKQVREFSLKQKENDVATGSTLAEKINGFLSLGLKEDEYTKGKYIKMVQEKGGNGNPTGDAVEYGFIGDEVARNSVRKIKELKGKKEFNPRQKLTPQFINDILINDSRFAEFVNDLAKQGKTSLGELLKKAIDIDAQIVGAVDADKKSKDKLSASEKAKKDATFKEDFIKLLKVFVRLMDEKNIAGVIKAEGIIKKSEDDTSASEVERKTQNAHQANLLNQKTKPAQNTGHLTPPPLQTNSVKSDISLMISEAVDALLLLCEGGENPDAINPISGDGSNLDVDVHALNDHYNDTQAELTGAPVVVDMFVKTMLNFLVEIQKLLKIADPIDTPVEFTAMCKNVAKIGENLKVIRPETVTLITDSDNIQKLLKTTAMQKVFQHGGRV